VLNFLLPSKILISPIFFPTNCSMKNRQLSFRTLMESRI